MMEQCSYINSKGLTAVFLGQEGLDYNDVASGKYQFLLTSPETILENVTWRNMLREDTFKSNIGLIVIDEAHTTVEWGVAKTEDVPFRTWFSKIGELRSLLPGAIMLALTATASRRHRLDIKQLICMTRCKDVIENPDRVNIKLHMNHIESKSKHEETFGWLLQLLRDKKAECPRVILFCKSISDCGKLYFTCKLNLPKMIMKHVDMFHSQTPDSTKLSIRNDMADAFGNVRLLICTSAAGMGVNFANIQNVIHFGPPQEMDTFLQQLGRAGRSGEQSHHLLIFNNRQLRNASMEMLEYVRNEEHCRRSIILSKYDSKCAPDRILHDCCDICDKICECVDCTSLNQCNIPIWHVDNDVDSEDSDEDLALTIGTNDISHDSKNVIRIALKEYQRELNNRKGSDAYSACPVVTHGLTDDVIETILEKCRNFQCPDDILAQCSIWTFEQAKYVHEIISTVLSTTTLHQNDDIEFDEYVYDDDLMQINC